MRTIPRLASILALCAILALSIISCGGGGGGDSSSPAAGGNSAPVANAGLDQTTYIEYYPISIALDGSLSSDPDNNDITYSWTELSNNCGASLSGPTTVNPSFYITSGIQCSIELQLVVNDGTVDSAPDTVVISLVTATAADAGTDQDIIGLTPVTLDGSGSSSITGISGYTWTFDSVPAGSSLTDGDITGPDTVSPSFTPDAVGPYVLMLEIGSGQCMDCQIVLAQDTVTINVLISAETPASAGDLVITEIMKNPFNLLDSEGEWIELYNPSDSVTFDLDGCEIYDLGVDLHVISGSVIVPPGGFVTLANGASPGFTPDYVYSSDITLGNASDEVGLRCDINNIDIVEYDDINFPDISGQSMTLSQGHFDYLSNDTGSNWCTSTEIMTTGDFGTPGADNTDCLIN